MQGAQHDEGIDGGPGQFGGHILGNAGQAQHMDLELLSGRPHRLKVLARVVLQAQDQGCVLARVKDG